MAIVDGLAAARSRSDGPGHGRAPAVIGSRSAAMRGLPSFAHVHRGALVARLGRRPATLADGVDGGDAPVPDRPLIERHAAKRRSEHDVDEAAIHASASSTADGRLRRDLATCRGLTAPRRRLADVLGYPRRLPDRSGGRRVRRQARRALLEPVHGLAALLQAGHPRRPSWAIDTPLDVGPPLPDRRRLRRARSSRAGSSLTAWAQATERVRIGLMVGANTFREPALTAKMATTLDHISDGRAILGIGGGVVRGGARGVRADVRVRASRSGCAGSARRCRSCAGCSTASEPTATGPRYARDATSAT